LVTDGTQTFDFGFRASVNWQKHEVATVYLVLDQSMAFLGLVNLQTHGRLRKLFCQDAITRNAISLIPDYSQSCQLTGAVCDIQMNKTTFVNGDTLIAKVQVKNPGTVAVPAEIKVSASLPPPGAPVAIVNIGADGSLMLGPGFDTGLVQLIPPLTITSALPRGPYGLNCRILDPVTGELRAEDLNPFTIQ